jgi:hypothetical protein
MADLFLQMAVDCVEFAHAARHVKDYTDFCKRQLGPGTAYYDRIRVKDQLIDEGFIRVEGNRLRLGVAKAVEWLERALADGESSAWELCDYYPKRRLKFDPDDTASRELGLAGELYVIECLKDVLPQGFEDRIIHVSLEDDSAGFDIRTPSVSRPESELLFEVKTSSRTGPTFRLFLSRNEVETGLRNANWYLVLVTAHQGNLEIAGSLKLSAIADLLPQDTCDEASWLSLKLVLQLGELVAGLPNE